MVSLLSTNLHFSARYQLFLMFSWPVIHIPLHLEAISFHRFAAFYLVSLGDISAKHDFSSRRPAEMTVATDGHGHLDHCLVAKSI